MMAKLTKGYLLFFLGITLFLTGTVGVILDVLFFKTWYFCFAWWGYILSVDGFLVNRGKESFVLSRRFLLLCVGSAVMWFGFEACNLRLKNWVYMGLPSHLGVRWFGYWMAFSTVLPGIFLTEKLITYWGLFQGIRSFKWHVSHHSLLILGAMMVGLSLLWPLYFFPLIWGGFFFLFEAYNMKKGWSHLLGLAGLAKWRTASIVPSR